MAFADIRTAHATRSSGVTLIFPRISSILGDVPHQTPADVNSIKGLLFVHMYGVLEFAFENAVMEMIRALNALRIARCDIDPTCYSAALFSEMKSFKDCGAGKYVSGMNRVFYAPSTVDLVTIEEGAFLDKVQSLSPDGMGEVAKAFGIASLGLSRPQEQRILEVTQKRHGIAHGRDTPEDVGSRYSFAQIQTIKADLDGIADRIFSAFEQHYDARTFVKVSERHKYA